MRVNTVSLQRLGRIEVRDLRVISEYLGRDFLPFPLIPTLAHRFADLGAYRDYARTVPDRFKHGDLAVFGKWFATYAEADLRVECQVHHFPADSPSTRLLAHRTGELGFLAEQQADDVVDMFTLSAYDLGPAVAGTVELTNPGTRPRIVIPEYVPQALRGRATTASDPTWGVGAPVSVSKDAVIAYGTVQSHCRPARTWGLDQDKDAVVWVRLRDDGDYIYAPGYRSATPMSRRDLSGRIDELIAADVASLRVSRGN
ncbi:ESX secretion-associated protein EspG [Mycobacterium asiaticum]|uniref:ESX secretion-associated protein EspG n=1 Tax=Mycobacterium asiaticum TaxID=1790 RepID=A0A1A3KKM8_MYCAS|nr:ESX secretion-associated protein EspG [Mycobacterium asiaticum]OBJ84521.1 hypothetical protein A5640_15450 [Mycobacterium asiaticum]